MSTPQASSTKRFDMNSFSEHMSTIHIELTEIEELVADPSFTSVLSNIIDGIPVESEADVKKHSVIQLFDQLCMKEQDQYRKLMKSKTDTGDLAKM